VRRAELVDIDLELRPALNERTARARVVQVDVGQEQSFRTRVAERLEQHGQARRGPRVDQHAAHLPAADHALATEMP